MRRLLARYATASSTGRVLSQGQAIMGAGRFIGSMVAGPIFEQSIPGLFIAAASFAFVSAATMLLALLLNRRLPEHKRINVEESQGSHGEEYESLEDALAHVGKEKPTTSATPSSGG